MSSLNILFGTPRANGLLAMQCLAPMAGAVAAQLVACNRVLSFPALTLWSKRPGPAPHIVAPPPVAGPRKVPTVVYQSRTISGKAGAVTLAAMPVPQKPMDIQ